MDCTKSHHPNVLARWPSRGAGSARMTAVTAYPTIGPNSGNSARSAEDIWPWFRGRTLKVSMALATLGLVIFLSASIKVSSSRAGSAFSDGQFRILLARLARAAFRVPLFPTVYFRILLARLARAVFRVPLFPTVYFRILLARLAFGCTSHYNVCRRLWS